MKDKYIIQKRHRKYDNNWSDFKSSSDIGSLMASFFAIHNNQDLDTKNFRFKLVQEVYLNGSFIRREIGITSKVN